MWIIVIVVVIILAIILLWKFNILGLSDEEDEEDEDEDKQQEECDEQGDESDGEKCVTFSKDADAPMLYKKLHRKIEDMTYDDFMKCVPEGTDLQFINIKNLYETKKMLNGDLDSISIDDYKEALNMC